MARTRASWRSPVSNLACVIQVAQRLGYTEVGADGSGLFLFESEPSHPEIAPDIVVVGMDKVGDTFEIEDALLVRLFENNGTPRAVIHAELEQLYGA